MLEIYITVHDAHREYDKIDREELIDNSNLTEVIHSVDTASHSYNFILYVSFNSDIWFWLNFGVSLDICLLYTSDAADE